MSAPMRVSAQKVGEQDRIWDWVGNRTIETNAQMRTVTGDWCEELVARCLQGIRHQIDSQADVCPDVELIHQPLDGDHYVEVKSCRHSGALLFKKRLAKDRRLEASGARLFYAFVRTTCPLPSLPAQLFAIRCALALPRFQILIVPSRRVRGWARSQEARAMWQGGPLGYRMPWGAIEQLAGVASTNVGDYEAKTQVYGNAVRAVFRGSMMWQVLPRLSDTERENANRMLVELGEQRLGVVLLPAPRPQYQGHMVRALDGRNPDWYRRLAAKGPGDRHRPCPACKASLKGGPRCQRHKRPRSGHKPGPGIRRYLIEAALERLSNDAHPRTPEDMRLLPLIREHTHHNGGSP